MRPPLIVRATVLSALLTGSCLPSLSSAEVMCPVTKPSAVKFLPNGAFAGQETSLLSDEKLFTVFPGAWNFIRPEDHTEHHRYLIPKIVWGSNIFDLDGTLTITGRRLDAASGPLEFQGAHLAQTSQGKAITSSFSVPALGCWEVVGHFHGTDLRIVIDLK